MDEAVTTRENNILADLNEGAEVCVCICVFIFANGDLLYRKPTNLSEYLGQLTSYFVTKKFDFEE